MNKKHHSTELNNKSIRVSHFGTYGSRQPVSGSDHKKNIHDKVDNFKRKDGFRRRTVQGVNPHLHKYPEISPNLIIKHSKKSGITRSIIIVIVLIICILTYTVVINS